MLGKFTPSAAIGIDIGAKSIHVATSTDRHHPIHKIDLNDPNWAITLIDLIPPGAAVAFEPIGWHYSAPIVTTIEQVPGVQIIQVEHHTTQHIRNVRISGVKNDTTDSRALYYIAATYNAEPLIGARPIEHRTYDKVIDLRLLVSAYARADKETTRSTNRLHQLAHSIWPTLNQHLDPYLRAISIGAITPADLRELAEEIKTGNTFGGIYTNSAAKGSLYKLAQSIPMWVDGQKMRSAIEREAKTLEYQDNQKQTIEAQIQAVKDAIKQLLDSRHAQWLVAQSPG